MVISTQEQTRNLSAVDMIQKVFLILLSSTLFLCKMVSLSLSYSGSRGGLMVSALVSGWSGQGLAGARQGQG